MSALSFCDGVASPGPEDEDEEEFGVLDDFEDADAFDFYSEEDDLEGWEEEDDQDLDDDDF